VSAIATGWLLMKKLPVSHRSSCARLACRFGARDYFDALKSGRLKVLRGIE
jgi:hypothetical protein